jgi:hypothetical protein
LYSKKCIDNQAVMMAEEIYTGIYPKNYIIPSWFMEPMNITFRHEPESGLLFSDRGI